MQVAQLSNFYLQLTFQRAGALSENIEDELRAIDHAQFELVLQVARLGGGQGLVKDGERGATTSGKFANFASFAASDERAGVDGFETLLDLRGNLCAGAFGESAEFGQRAIERNAFKRTGINADDDCAFRLTMGFE